jgi:aminoglycoside 6-adenylyltransferase
VSGVDGFLAELAVWAAARDDVRAVVLVGSQARTETPADEWSDVDVVLFVDDPRPYAADPAWVARFETAALTFVEPTAVGGQVERRVLNTTGLEVDFSLMPAASVPALTADPEAAAVVARGYAVLYDEIGVGEALADMSAIPPREIDLAELAQDFWYHALWTAKKHRRGESVTARDCIEGTLKQRLIELAREHARLRDPAADTWHRDRFVERWADARTLAALWESAASPDELPAALVHVCDAFDALAGDLLPPDAGIAVARRRLQELLA